MCVSNTVYYDECSPRNKIIHKRKLPLTSSWLFTNNPNSMQKGSVNPRDFIYILSRHTYLLQSIEVAKVRIIISVVWFLKFEVSQYLTDHNCFTHSISNNLAAVQMILHFVCSFRLTSYFILIKRNSLKLVPYSLRRI